MTNHASGLPFDDIRNLLKDIPGPDQGAMEKCRARAPCDERIPPFGLGAIAEGKRPDYQIRRRGGRQTRFGGVVFHGLL